MKKNARTIEDLQIENLKWERIRSATAHTLGDYSNADWNAIEAAQRRLTAVVPVLGHWSISRKALTSLGSALVRSKGEPLTILVPICSYQEVGALTESPVKLVQSHLAFLEKVAEILPVVKALFLFPTHTKSKSGEDRDVLCKTVDEIQWRLRGSFHQALAMEDLIPDIADQEDRMKDELRHSMPPEWSSLFETLHRGRSDYYARRGLAPELWEEWTRKGIAEFSVLGRFAVATNSLISCHSTRRISCLIKVGAGVLHNPIGCE